MNKKGFTLIEITAVVLTLAVIFLVSYPTLHRILKKSEKDENEITDSNIIVAAKTYFNLHNSEYSFLDGSTLPRITSGLFLRFLILTSIGCGRFWSATVLISV